MQRAWFLIWTIVTGVLSPLAAAEPAARPNVVLILADDLGAMDLGCYGSTFHRTPELDRMAAEGLRFTQGYAACPVCSPTRAALMTGKVPARLHLTDWLPGRPDRPDHQLARPVIRQELPLEEVTLAERFRAAGYATGHIGKWHLGGDGFSPLEQGFDVNIAGDHTGTPLSYFAPFTKGGRDMPGLGDAPAGEYLTDRLAAEAERFIDQHQQRPFFLYLPHFAVHTPMRAPGELVKQFPGETPFVGKQNNPTYAAMLLALDTAVGRVRKKLAACGLTDKTLVIFTSDNGGLATNEGPTTPATSNAPLREGKGWLYEGGIRVPWIMAGHGIANPGRTDATPIISHDLVPTLATLCGLEPGTGVDGVDLSSVLAATGQPAPRPLFWHYPHYANQGSRPGGVHRDGDWKLIEFYETGRRELFDLAKDPGEHRNIAPEHPEQVLAMGTRLHAWLDDVGAQRNTPNPGYRPGLPADDGTITLHARTAYVDGVMLRYEPLPHKSTLGYWVHEQDTAWWDLDVIRPGRYEVEALVGCGHGSGGSLVEFRFGDQVLSFTVPETGGFQKFQPQALGTVTFATTGRRQIRVVPVRKPGPAVMDLRQITLKPAAN